jgi:PAS domain S-box-containing protein
MRETRQGVSYSVFATLGVGGTVALWLLFLGRRDYPSLHGILDAAACVLTGVLALLLGDIGRRTRQALPAWLAAGFTAAFLSELVHTAVIVEWFGALGVIATAQSSLRPATWPIAAYVLPIGACAAIWLSVRFQRHVPVFFLALVALSVLLFPVFYILPRYTAPAGSGVTRPLLLGVPILWGCVALMCWRRRKSDRLYPMLALTSVVMIVASLAMLYSRAPHDTQAMVAHLGKFVACLTLMLFLMQAAAADMHERVVAERSLAALNTYLESRIAKRTAELQLAYERTRAIFEASLDGVIVMDSNGRIDQFSPAAEAIFGRRRSDVVGHSLADTLVPPPLRDAHRAGLARYLATGNAAILGRRIEIDGLRADGTLVPLELSIHRMPGTEGVAFAGFVRDLTERRHTERKVATQLARLDLFNRIAKAIGERQDLRSIMQVVVRRLEEDLPVDFCCACEYEPDTGSLTISSVGVRSEALAVELGMRVDSRLQPEPNGLSRCLAGTLVYEPDTGQVQSALPQRLARGGLHSLVLSPLRLESRVFGVLVTARAAPQGFSSAECEFLRQLSEQVALAVNQAETHAALQRAYDDLRQTQLAVMQQERLRALGQMASGIAHDINNAISPVTLYADLLLEHERGMSEQGRERLKIIQRAIGDVEHTVARMREFYRQREPQLEFAPVQLNEIALQVMELTRARWSDMPQQRGVVIQPRVDLAPDLPAILGVEAEIREALINLIFNAVDAMPDGGVLSLRTGRSGADEVFILVSDTGMGMDESTRLRCMEPFFTTKGERGTGLGLAMVYGVMQRHDAEVVIDSSPGAGTIVQLKFRKSQALHAMPAPDSSGRPRSALRLLVIDDDPLLLKAVSETLRADGHLITTAAGGQQGIDIFEASFKRNEFFAAVITDLGMPHVDGRSVARAIKTLSNSTPVILLTGWGQRLMAEGDVPPHVDLVLSKPPKLRVLREALARCCG